MSGFGTELLNVAIGMAFVYMVMSLIASAMLEVVEAGLRTRAKYLWQGIGEILGDGRARDRLTQWMGAPAAAARGPVTLEKFYEHPIIGGMYYGTYDTAAKPAAMRKLPGYIPRESFSTAVIDLVSRLNTRPNMSAMQALRNGTSELPPNAPVRKALEAITRLAGDDVSLVQQRLEAWYDGAMDRVSGWYKRHAQVMLLGIGFLLAWAVPVDSWRLVQDLLHNEPKRQALVSAAGDYAAAHAKPDMPLTADEMKNFLSALDAYQSPIAPLPPATPPATPAEENPWLAIPGLLVTAFAISLGAPFWFDLLNRFMVLRGAIKPKEQGSEAADKTAGAGTGAAAPAVFVRGGGI